jgi:hypothetical protein
VIRAGAFVEIRAGQTGWDPEARDLTRIASWREAMLPYYGADGWTRVYAESFRALRNWYARPEVKAVFREAAPVIARQMHLSSQAILALYQGSGASTCPAPFFGDPVMPHRQPVSAPRVSAPAFSPSVRRRGALQAVAREPVLPGEHRKPANFGCNADGTPRSFTAEEMAYVQAIQRGAFRQHTGS